MILTSIFYLFSSNRRAANCFFFQFFHIFFILIMFNSAFNESMHSHKKIFHSWKILFSSIDFCDVVLHTFFFFFWFFLTNTAVVFIKSEILNYFFSSRIIHHSSRFNSWNCIVRNTRFEILISILCKLIARLKRVAYVFIFIIAFNLFWLIMW